MMFTGIFVKNSGMKLVLATFATTMLNGVANGAATEAPSTQPAALSPATPETRELRAIVADFQSISKNIAQVIGESSNLGTAAKRTEMAPKLVPLLQKQVAIFDELMKQPTVPAAQIAPMKQQATAMLYLLNDGKTVATVEAMSTSADKSQVESAKTTKFLASWMSAANDATAQGKLADDLVVLDRARPADSKLTSLSYALSRQTKDKVIAEKLMTAACAMNTPMAKAVQAQAEGAKKLAGLENKPLTMSGKTVDDKEFTTDSLKGKVILVDFWATWCGPCKAELPRVKKIYAQYHDKGLEIVGVSNDYKASALTDYIGKNEMPWTELFNEEAASGQQWNPITLDYGINGIPTMFLIDKKGVCRTVEARQNMEAMIPSLLAE